MGSEQGGIVRYRGRTRSGIAFTGAGREGEKAAVVAERLYDRETTAWAQLLDADGREVGRVDRTAGWGWWAEDCLTSSPGVC